MRAILLGVTSALLWAVLAHAQSTTTAPTLDLPSRSEVWSGPYIDTALFWREASGPNGERNPAALPLYEAIFAHDVRRVASLLDAGTSPNALLAPGGWSALMVAIAYDDQPIIEQLVKRGVDLNYVSDDRATGTALVVAVSYGRFYKADNTASLSMRYLVDAGADLNLEFHDKDIALAAVNVGQIAVVSELLARGYRRDLPLLKRWLEIVQVSPEVQADKTKALSTVNALLAKERQRAR